MHKVLLPAFMLILFNAAYGQQRLVYNHLSVLVPNTSNSNKVNNNAVKPKKPLDAPAPIINWGHLAVLLKHVSR
jgi:hypothetical protein